MTGQRDRVQVVIAGAGPVGCVAATYLAQHGIDILVAEANDDSAQDLRASTFHPPSLEMLDTLGVADRLIDMGLKAPIYHWRDRRSGEVISFDLSELEGDTPFPFRIQCEQYHLAKLLSQQLERQDSAEMLFNHRLVHCAQDNAGVTVTLEHMSGLRTVKADFLIGADGANSIVRKWLGVEFDGFTYPEKFLCLSTERAIDQEIPNLAYVNYISDPHEWLVLLRVPTLWRVLVPANEDEGAVALQSDEKKNQVFGGLLGEGEGEKVVTKHRTIYRVHQRVAKRFRVGRAVLIGDSAHLNNPLGGFGMNSGIHDAFNACEKIVAILKGEASEDVLDLYDRQRRTVTHDFTQQQTIENMAIMRGGQSEAHRRKLTAMRMLASDPEKRRAYLLRQSMIASLREANAIE